MNAAVPSSTRLSKLRVAVALIIALVIILAGAVGLQSWFGAKATASTKPWFAAYVDVTATPTFGFETPANESAKHVVLSFIVADQEDGCVPTWGTAYTLDEASYSLDLDRRIARLEQQGGSIVVSFGGLINSELARACSDDDRLVEAYASVIDRYGVSTIDLDIEGEDLSDSTAGERRAKAIAEVQAQQRADGEELAVWMTLPASTSGLTEQGADAVSQMLDAGVDLAGVNAMTMNFGQSLDEGETMAEATARALDETHRQLGVLYKRSDIQLSDATLWSKIGATPMVGQNDHQDEVFGVADATAANEASLKAGIGRMSMWSLNRDVTCGTNYVDWSRVSDSCSGIDQGELRFAEMLGKGFDGDPDLSAGVVTSDEPVDPADLVDNPATSPYPIWAEDSSYLAGTKVVWHRNVYETKWWTRGDLPDDPVLNAWETPWALIGPVLPGEKPYTPPTIAPGILTEWSGKDTYERGTLVELDGVPYEAKWWTEGDSPESASSDPDGSPWVQLTEKQIAELVLEKAEVEAED